MLRIAYDVLCITLDSLVNSIGYPCDSLDNPCEVLGIV